MAPLSRSATTQESAERSPGTGGGFAAVTTPQPPSELPPIGDGGTGSDNGGSPACGTSEESTAGGVATLNGHWSCTTAGSANAAGVPSSAGAVNMPSNHTCAAAARHDAVRKSVIVCAE